MLFYSKLLYIFVQVVAAPIQVGTLYLPMPWAIMFQMPAMLIGEVWLSVAVSIVLDLVPSDLTTSATALYFFFMQIVGGNVNMLITPIREATDLRTALLITFPGLYLVGAMFFGLAALVLALRRKNSYDLDNTVIVEKSLDNEKKFSSESSM